MEPSITPVPGSVVWMGVANPSEDLLIEGRIPEGTVHPNILTLLHRRRLGHLDKFDTVGQVDGDGYEIHDMILVFFGKKTSYNQTTLERVGKTSSMFNCW